eukprot:1814757-Prymnesium_polylepis.2
MASNGAKTLDFAFIGNWAIRHQGPPKYGIYMQPLLRSLGPKNSNIPSATRHAAVARRTGETGRWNSRDGLRTQVF